MLYFYLEVVMQTVWGASQDDKIIQKKYMETNKISESMRQIRIQIRTEI